MEKDKEREGNTTRFVCCFCNGRYYNRHHHLSFSNVMLVSCFVILVLSQSSSSTQPENGIAFWVV